MKRWLDRAGMALIASFVGSVVAVVVVPFAYAMVMSVDPRRYLGGFPPPGISLQWYERFFTDDRYVRALGISLLLAFATGIAATVLGSLAALGLSRLRPGARGLGGVPFAMPQLVPHVMIGFALLLTFAAAGVGGGFLALLSAHVVIALPYVVRAVGAALAGLRPSLVEAALSLGASRARAALDIVFPLVRASLVVGFVFAVVVSLDEVAASVFLTVPGVTTLPVNLLSDMRASFDLTIAAASVLMILLCLCLIVLVDIVVGLDRLLGRGVHGGGGAGR